MTPFGWVGVWLLVGSVLLIVIEGVLVVVWSAALTKQTKALSQYLEKESGELKADVQRLVLALEETRRLWQPYRRLLRWARHPLTIALWQSYRRRASAR